MKMPTHTHTHCVCVHVCVHLEVLLAAFARLPQLRHFAATRHCRCAAHAHAVAMAARRECGRRHGNASPSTVAAARVGDRAAAAGVATHRDCRGRRRSKGRLFAQRRWRPERLEATTILASDTICLQKITTTVRMGGGHSDYLIDPSWCIEDGTKSRAPLGEAASGDGTVVARSFDIWVCWDRE